VGQLSAGRLGSRLTISPNDCSDVAAQVWGDSGSAQRDRTPDPTHQRAAQVPALRERRMALAAVVRKNAGLKRS